jgi:hypothetical protein
VAFDLFEIKRQFTVFVVFQLLNIMNFKKFYCKMWRIFRSMMLLKGKFSFPVKLN